MMGPRQEAQAALFYAFSLEDHVPQDHLLRSIDRFVDLSGIRVHLSDFYSRTGRPSIDPELLIRMLLIGYCFGTRSERRLCEEVHLNLAYRWFCRLDLTGRVPDHTTFSKNKQTAERSPEKNMKTPAMLLAPFEKPNSTKYQPSSERKSRCSSRISNASSGLNGCDCAARVVQKTNSCSPPPPKTCANWPRSFLHRSKRAKLDQKSARPQFCAPLSALATRCFSTEQFRLRAE